MSNKKIVIELTEFERDFILAEIRWALPDDLQRRLEKARVNKDQIVCCQVSKYELSEMIGNLSLEANHNESRQIQDTAYALAEFLESYE